MVRSSSRRAAAKRHPARAETLEVSRARGPPGPVTLRGLDFALGRGVVGVGDAGKRRRDAGEEHKREDHRSLHPDLPPFLLTVTTANTTEAIQRRSDEWTSHPRILPPPRHPSWPRHPRTRNAREACGIGRAGGIIQ